MIKKIAITNFEGISEEMTLDLTANPKRKSEAFLNEHSDDNILYFSSILGKNASGKSSFLKAIDFYASFTKGYIYPAIKEQMERKINEKIKNTNNIENDDLSLNSYKLQYEDAYAFLVEQHFHNPGKDMIISITYQEDKKELIHSVIWKDLKVEEKVILVKRGKEKIIESKKSLISDSPLEINKIMKDLNFSEFTFQVETSHKIVLSELINRSNLSFNPNKENKEKKMSKEYLKWMQISDEKIYAYELNIKGRVTGFKMANENGYEYTLPISDLSSGTKKWMNLFAPIVSALKGMKMLLTIDEFDIFLHNGLSDFIIQLFLNKNMNKMGSQLIIATHNPSVIRNTVRKESINLIMESKFENLGRDANLRKDFSWVKNYLDGNIGEKPSASNKSEFMKEFSQVKASFEKKEYFVK